MQMEWHFMWAAGIPQPAHPAQRGQGPPPAQQGVQQGGQQVVGGAQQPPPPQQPPQQPQPALAGAGGGAGDFNDGDNDGDVDLLDMFGLGANNQGFFRNSLVRNTLGFGKVFYVCITNLSATFGMGIHHLEMVCWMGARPFLCQIDCFSGACCCACCDAHPHAVLWCDVLWHVSGMLECAAYRVI